MSGRREIGKEPTHARALLGRLVDAGKGVELAARTFSQPERFAAAWLVARGWARRSRGRVAGQVTYGATEEGRAERARLLAAGDAFVAAAERVGKANAAALDVARHAVASLPRPKMDPAHRDACVDHYMRTHSARSLAELLVDLEHEKGVPPAVDPSEVDS